MFEPAKFNMVLCDKRKLKKLIGIKINAKIKRINCSNTLHLNE